MTNRFLIPKQWTCPALRFPFAFERSVNSINSGCHWRKLSRWQIQMMRLQKKILLHHNRSWVLADCRMNSVARTRRCVALETSNLSFAMFFPNISKHFPGNPQNIGKTPESSVPVLSAAKPWFSQRFSHIWPIALAFLHVHARACLHMLRRLVRCLGPW